MTGINKEELSTPELSTTRRRFYLAVINIVGAVIGAALAIPAFIYLFFPPRQKKGNEWVDVADVDQLKVNTPQEILFQRSRVDGWRVVAEKTSTWVVKTGPAQVTAFAPQCTHLGCAYHWDEQNKNFLCPCHTSTFSIDGKVLSGPAPRPLDKFAVKIDGNKLAVGPLDTHA
jgi:menaquinol-cytochrome c reductase iron-sulfur subunit